MADHFLSCIGFFYIYFNTSPNGRSRGLRAYFIAYKGSSQLAKKIFEKKQRESIDNGVNSKCVKFYGPMARKSGAKKYFKFLKSLTKAKNMLLSRDSNP